MPSNINVKRLNSKDVGFREILLSSLSLPSADDEAIDAAVVKILATGELKTKINFRVNKASQKAQDAIVAAGGTIEIIK